MIQIEAVPALEQRRALLERILAHLVRAVDVQRHYFELGLPCSWGAELQLFWARHYARLHLLCWLTDNELAGLTTQSAPAGLLRTDYRRAAA